MYVQFTNFAWLLCGTAAILTIDRSEENLTTFPDNIDTDVTTLILSKNSITRINDNSVATLIALEKLLLNDNGVKFISTHAFANNIHLSELRMTGHRLSTIPPGLGGTEKNLVSLYFGRGQRYIPTVYVTNFTALTKMNMNYLATNSLILHKLPSLKSLIAQDCGLQEFPDLTGAPELEIVQLHENKFNWVPQSAVAGLSRLKKLAFPFGRVMHLPDLSHLISLETLHIHDNALVTIPDIYELSITKINLKDNPLVCDKALCWVRMWDYTKPPIDVENSEKGLCAEPTDLRGLLMDVHPVVMKCYEGTQ